MPTEARRREREIAVHEEGEAVAQGEEGARTQTSRHGAPRRVRGHLRHPRRRRARSQANCPESWVTGRKARRIAPGNFPAAWRRGMVCPVERPADETTKSTKPTNQRRKAHGGAFWNACGIRRPGERRTNPPSAFRAGFVDVVGIVDVVERPGSGEGFPGVRPVDNRTKRPQDNSSRPARRRIEGREILLSCRPEVLLSTASWRGVLPRRAACRQNRQNRRNRRSRARQGNAQCSMRNAEWKNARSSAGRRRATRSPVSAPTCERYFLNRSEWVPRWTQSNCNCCWTTR